MSNVETPEVVSPTPSARSKAYKIRAAQRKGEEISPEDARWIEMYEQDKIARGASRTHKVSYTEESAEAAGTGDAAAIAAAQFAPALAREEGRRIDYLIAASNNATNIALQAVRESHKMVLDMAKQIMARNDSLEEVHLAMLDTVRDSHIARTNAEADLIRKEAESENDEKDLAGSVIAQMMPVVLAEIAKRQKLATGDTKK